MCLRNENLIGSFHNVAKLFHDVQVVNFSEICAKKISGSQKKALYLSLIAFISKFWLLFTEFIASTSLFDNFNSLYFAGGWMNYHMLFGKLR